MPIVGILHVSIFVTCPKCKNDNEFNVSDGYVKLISKCNNCAQRLDVEGDIRSFFTTSH